MVQTLIITIQRIKPILKLSKFNKGFYAVPNGNNGTPTSSLSPVLTTTPLQARSITAATNVAVMQRALLPTHLCKPIAAQHPTLPHDAPICPDHHTLNVSCHQKQQAQQVSSTLYVFYSSSPRPSPLYSPVSQFPGFLCTPSFVLLANHRKAINIHIISHKRFASQFNLAGYQKPNHQTNLLMMSSRLVLLS